MKKARIVGQATVAGKQYDLVPHQNQPRKKETAAKPAKTPKSFAATFRELYPRLQKVNKADKARAALHRRGRYPRWRIKSINFEGSAYHLVQLGMLMLLEGNHRPMTRAELFAGVEEVISESGLQMKKFDDQNFDNCMKSLLASKHVAFENGHYTFVHYPNFQTLAIVVS